MSKASSFLFIAGASRSGTTLLMNLLDGHRELVIFPMEHKVLSRYFTVAKSRHREYFTDAFIRDRSEGQQTVLASQPLYEQYRKRMTSEFGIDFPLEIDHERFLHRYQEVLAGGAITLETIFRGLAEALAASNAHAAQTYPHARYVVYKDPFTTEFFAGRAAAELPTAKFLHIIRDPYARYCSIKKRHIRKGSLLRRETTRRVNYVDFATGYAEQAVASLQAGLENQRVLGTERYLIMRFEDLVEEPHASLSRLASWLEVNFDSTLMNPSKLGEPIESGSSFSPASGIDHRTAGRGREYFLKMTSASERDVYNRCLAESEYARFYPLMPSTADSLVKWFGPYNRERIRDYCWRIATGQGRPRGDIERLSYDLKHRLPAMYTNGRIR